jgi:hypothetical protein
MELDARLAGRILESVPDVTADEQDTTPIAAEVESAVESDVTTTEKSEGADLAPGNPESAGTAAQASASQNDERHSDAHRSEDGDFLPQGAAIQESDEHSSSQGEHLTSEMAETSAEVGLSGSTDLKSLRARSWALARRLAQRHGIGELIAPLGDNGLGFLLRDGPDPALTEALDEDTLAQVSALWWVLAACSEMTVAPLDQLLPAMEDGSVLKQALREQDAQLLFSRVWTLDPGHMGHRLWRRLDERGWDEFVSLIQTYRRLHRTAEATGVSLWGSGR